MICKRDLKYMDYIIMTYHEICNMAIMNNDDLSDDAMEILTEDLILCEKLHCQILDEL